jgi:di/tricarboxylate transporter
MGDAERVREGGVATTSSSSHQSPQARIREAAPTVAGCAASVLALLNVYPQFFPFISREDKVIAITLCVLVTALAARLLHLAKIERLDAWLAMLICTLLLVMTLAVAWKDGPAQSPLAPTSNSSNARSP